MLTSIKLRKGQMWALLGGRIARVIEVKDDAAKLRIEATCDSHGISLHCHPRATDGTFVTITQEEMDAALQRHNAFLVRSRVN